MSNAYSRRTVAGRSLALAAVVLICGVSSWAQSSSAEDSGVAAPPPPKAAGNLSSADLAPKVLEPWSTPSLEGSQLKLQEVLVGDVSEYPPVFTRELTRVIWRPADPIDLYIIKPYGVKKPPVILYLYSYPSENDRFLQPDFCAFLSKNGIAAVGFSSALNGHRYQGRPMKEWFVSELQESLATSAHDVQMVLNYLGTRGDLDVSRVGIFGDGSGATIAILAAAVDPRIQALDLLNPWGDWPDWMATSTRVPENERPGFLKPEFMERIAPLDPVKWLPQLKTPKIRIQLVQTVTVTPETSKKKIEAAAPPQAQIVHYADAKEFILAAGTGGGFDWIKQQLQPDFVREYRAGDTPSSKPQSETALSPR